MLELAPSQKKHFGMLATVTQQAKRRTNLICSELLYKIQRGGNNSGSLK